MIKQLFLKSNPLLFFILLFIATGFTNNNAAKSITAKITSKDSSNPQISSLGDLHILWINNYEFKKLRGKTFFIFRFLSNDSITLTGWPAEGPFRVKYSTKPAIQLNVGKKIEIAYQPGTYFANVLLYGPEIKKIKDSISVIKDSIVLFIPYIRNDQIYYNIVLTNDKPNDQNKVINFTNTIVTANPSPPRKYTY